MLGAAPGSSPDFGMWHDLWVALALVMVIEGLLPFVSPGGMRRAMQTMAAQDNRTLRVSGLISMAVGVVFLYLVN